MSFLAPLFFIGLAAIAVPVIVHLIERERKDVIPFPSLMFIERVPYQSVERRRIHNWPLLLMRVGAMALIVAAFTRPFLTADPVSAAGAASGAREVVILLDRSASMGYGNAWERARAEALRIVDGMSGADEGTLVLFSTGAEEAVRATTDRSQLETAINAAEVSDYATRFAPALRLAQSILLRSTLPRREIVLISDFQRSGWERREEVALPEGATLTPMSVAEPGTADVSVASAVFQRGSFSGEERVSVVAGLTNRSPTRVDNLDVTLEVDGRPIDSRRVSIEPNASASVTFPPVTVAQASM
ncbi:MAG TPA: BatA and WFA domain-containing protein, partial [Vicinamibacterales bacterium]|nr:BatA and WFA domain-containing protein [Vicinamibacterales bacterium]